MENSKKTNIVLIGMAGAGKSTVGRKLADLLGLAFVDVDTLIEKDRGLPLQEVLNDLGVQNFRRLEEQTMLSMDFRKHVIATGGSAIYGQAGISHLRRSSMLILLDVGLATLKQRVGDFSSRAFVKTADQTFAEVFAERQPLYTQNADLIIDCNDRSVSDICQSIIKHIPDTFYHF